MSDGLIPQDGPEVFGEPPQERLPADGTPPRPRLLRRWLAVSVVAVTALGVLGSGIAVAVDQHHEQVRKERIATEKRAANAYVKAIRPISIRVFDAVQPIQDSFDAYRDLRPGLWFASLDVVTRSGALAELTVARRTLVAQKAPATHRAAAIELQAALKDLVVAVEELAKAYRAAAKSAAACVTCLAEDHLGAAELAWSQALLKLSAEPPMAAPALNRGLAYGRTVPTLGGFIHASDVACAKAQHESSLLSDIKTAEQARTTLPKAASILRTSVDALRRLKMPESRAAQHHRLDIELQSVRSLARTYDQIAAAIKAQNPAAYNRALALLDDQDLALRKLSSTYRTIGVSRCATWFSVEEKQGSKERLSA